MKHTIEHKDETVILLSTRNGTENKKFFIKL